MYPCLTSPGSTILVQCPQAPGVSLRAASPLRAGVPPPAGPPQQWTWLSKMVGGREEWGGGGEIASLPPTIWKRILQLSLFLFQCASVSFFKKKNNKMEFKKKKKKKESRVCI
ncbi:MANSC domain-containing protein 4 [Platysternon megacephalum]|uniref:MANSC domain-containing protein 4 n=1 Tax=Platysternon megacephalum TaxID=55544 RepID=A0A4D9EJE7_9SAUR|nr:MANSC domain-containing protein 4 [Platysternon megacephalum]